MSLTINQKSLSSLIINLVLFYIVVALGNLRYLDLDGKKIIAFVLNVKPNVICKNAASFLRSSFTFLTFF